MPLMLDEQECPHALLWIWTTKFHLHYVLDSGIQTGFGSQTEVLGLAIL